MPSQPEVRIGVDFTRVRADDSMTVSIESLKEDAGYIPPLHSIVELYENDGQTCWAVVSKIKDYTIQVHLIWSTYRIQIVSVSGAQTRSAPVPAEPGGGRRNVTWSEWKSTFGDVGISRSAR